MRKNRHHKKKIVKILIMLFIAFFVCQTSYAKNYEGPSTGAKSRGRGRTGGQARSVTGASSRPLYLDNSPCNFNTLSEQSQLMYGSKFFTVYSPKPITPPESKIARGIVPRGCVTPQMQMVRDEIMHEHDPRR